MTKAILSGVAIAVGIGLLVAAAFAVAMFVVYAGYRSYSAFSVEEVLEGCVWGAVAYMIVIGGVGSGMRRNG